jgi:ankyrin repeat protein
MKAENPFRRKASRSVAGLLLNRKRLVSVIMTMSVALLSCTRYSHSLEVSSHVAACDGDFSKTKTLLMLGANINATDVRGYSALMDAEACPSRPGRPELVELLIAKGAAVNLQARNGRTALMYAAKNGDTQAVKALLKSGASVNIADNEGRTALMEAVQFSCDKDTIRALVDAGADLKATDHQGQSALSSTCLKSGLGGIVLPDTR